MQCSVLGSATTLRGLTRTAVPARFIAIGAQVAGMRKGVEPAGAVRQALRSLVVSPAVAAGTEASAGSEARTDDVSLCYA